MIWVDTDAVGLQVEGVGTVLDVLQLVLVKVRPSTVGVIEVWSFINYIVSIINILNYSNGTILAATTFSAALASLTARFLNI